MLGQNEIVISVKYVKDTLLLLLKKSPCKYLSYYNNVCKSTGLQRRSPTTRMCSLLKMN